MGSFLRPNPLWNTAILVSGDDPFDLVGADRVALFGSRKVRRSPNAIHTHADPFLFEHEGELFVFMEVQRVDQRGKIAAFRTRDLVNYDKIDQILNLDEHASYPQVFRSEWGIHLLPETRASGEVALYTFGNFPFDLHKQAVLLTGEYDDPTIFRHAGLWWLFVSSSVGLQLFYSESVSGPFVPHPVGVITASPCSTRCGGAIVEIDGTLFRPTQDLTDPNIRNLSLMKIEELSTEVYRETLYKTDLFKRDNEWCEQGGHHISIADFNGRTIIAVDGMQNDLWLNKPISAAIRTLSNGNVGKAQGFVAAFLGQLGQA